MTRLLTWFWRDGDMGEVSLVIIGTAAAAGIVAQMVMS